MTATKLFAAIGLVVGLLWAASRMIDDHSISGVDEINLHWGYIRKAEQQDHPTPIRPILRDVPQTEQEKWRQANHDYRGCWVEDGKGMRCPEDQPR